MKELINVENQTEYYKNGNVKAYVSHLYHYKLQKRVKVSHRDHYTYLEKFNNAKKLLEMEWEQECENKRIKAFVEKSTKLHQYSSYMYEFDYNEFAKKQAKKENLINIYNPKYKNDIRVPKKPEITDSQYTFTPKWYHKLFVNIRKREAELRSWYEYDLKNYTNLDNQSTDIKTYNKNEDVKYKISKENHNLKHNELKEKYSAVLSNYENTSSKNDVVIYFSTLLECRNGLFDIYNNIDVDIDFDAEDKTLIVDFELPNNTLYPKSKEKHLIKSKMQFKEILYKEKERNEIISTSYYSIYFDN